MSYTPYLIANYATGFDKELEPWLVPDDAYIQLLDGYVYRGVTHKRDGYSGFANGIKSTYCESRMVHRVTAEAYGTGNGTAGPYVHTAANLPIRRGTITITAGAQTATDNGNGVFVTTPPGGTGTINYTTGQMSVTFNAAVAGATPITVTYDYHQGLPVMGIMSFYPIDNNRRLIVADTRYVNKYNPLTDRLDDIPAGTYHGTNSDFWSWVNYADANSAPRLLFSNGFTTDVIQSYDGTTISNYAAVFDGAPFVINAQQMFEFKDRLILFKTVEAGTLFPRRIRISGLGDDCDQFGTDTVGAGLIDIPDNTWFFGAAANRDDILFFTESSTWALKYTGNDVTPFILQKIDGTRGCSASFSVISYLNRTMAASPRGLIMCDGYNLDRMDDNIPDFSFNEIDGTNFNHCFSGFFDEDRDVYTLYPSKGAIKPRLVPPDASDRMLVSNFEEDNYAVFRIPLSTVGNFQSAFTLLWSDLTAENGFQNWDTFGIRIGNWNAFPYTKDTPIAIGGGHKGEIWRLNDAESEDNPQKIRNITIVNDQRITVTTDWNNYELGDFIVFEEVLGMTQINDKQGQIISIGTDYNVFDVDFGQSHGGFSAYTSGGTATRVIPFDVVTKKFNPWINSNKKLKCGWIYFYVEVSGTDLTDWDTNSTPVRAQLQIDVLTNNNEDDDFSDPQFTYLVDCSPINNEKGGKKWVKIWINQVGQFLQFRMSNNQAGAQIQVHAIMPAFQSVGRLI